MLAVRSKPASLVPSTSSISSQMRSQATEERLSLNMEMPYTAAEGAVSDCPPLFYSISENTNHYLQDRDALFAALTPLVKRLCWRYGIDAEMRQDLIGEIYYRLSLLLNSYDPSQGVPLYPYLVRQLTASLHTFARQRRCRQRREIHLDTLQDGHEALVCLPEEEWNHRIVSQQRMNRITHSLQRLPRRQQEVVMWRFFDELSFQEIAERLGIQESTARSLLRHGLAKLRQWNLKQGAAKKEARLWLFDDAHTI